MPALVGVQKRTFGPLALTTTLTTNIYNQNSSQIYDVIKHIHVTNKTASPATLTIYLGGSGANIAGTELFNARVIDGNSSYDWYGSLRMESTDYLVGGSNTTTALSIVAEGKQYIFYAVTTTTTLAPTTTTIPPTDYPTTTTTTTTTTIPPTDYPTTTTTSTTTTSTTTTTTTVAPLCYSASYSVGTVQTSQINACGASGIANTLYVGQGANLHSTFFDASCTTPASDGWYGDGSGSGLGTWYRVNGTGGQFSTGTCVATTTTTTTTTTTSTTTTSTTIPPTGTSTTITPTLCYSGSYDTEGNFTTSAALCANAPFAGGTTLYIGQDGTAWTNTGCTTRPTASRYRGIGGTSTYIFIDASYNITGPTAC